MKTVRATDGDTSRRGEAPGPRRPAPAMLAAGLGAVIALTAGCTTSVAGTAVKFGGPAPPAANPCMSCNGQLDLGTVAAGTNGALDDPGYIAGLGGTVTTGGAQNVTLLSVNAAAGLLAQYVSLTVAPGGLGEPGPLQYLLSTHTLRRLPALSRGNCPVEAITGTGDHGIRLTGDHTVAENTRRARAQAQLGPRVRVGRAVDDIVWRARLRLGAFSKSSLRGERRSATSGSC